MAIDKYLRRVHETIDEARTYVSSAGLSEVENLVEHGEPAEALCSLAWAIVNEQAIVPRALIKAIRAQSSGLCR